MAEKSAHCLEMPVGRGLSSILTFSSKESRGGVVEIHCAGLDLGLFFSKAHRICGKQSIKLPVMPLSRREEKLKF